MKKSKIRNTRDGFTLAEILVSLAITGILIAAIAVAFDASVINYNQNRDHFLAVNNARQALLRVTTELRTAQAVNPDSLVNQCTFVDAGGNTITYRFDGDTQKLYLDKAGSSYTLCENVTALTFTKTTDTVDSVTYVKSVQLLITVSIGDAQKTLVAATVIRKNLG